MPFVKFFRFGNSFKPFSSLQCGSNLAPTTANFFQSTFCARKKKSGVQLYQSKIQINRRRTQYIFNDMFPIVHTWFGHIQNELRPLLRFLAKLHNHLGHVVQLRIVYPAQDAPYNICAKYNTRSMNDSKQRLVRVQNYFATLDGLNCLNARMNIALRIGIWFSIISFFFRPYHSSFSLIFTITSSLASMLWK